MKIISRRHPYKGFYKLNRIEISDGGNVIAREQFETTDSVAALVFDTEGKKFILVRQFRPGPERELTEIVAGRMDVPGEEKETTIKREILEETGFQTDSLEYLGGFYASPGSSTENIHIFYAEVSKKEGKGGGLGDENISTVEFSPGELQSQMFGDAKTQIAVLWHAVKTMRQ